jgi:hypothetical protein
MVGLGRLERPTSPLSGVRSNHLSYKPEDAMRPGEARPPSRGVLETRCPGEKRNEDGGVPPRGSDRPRVFLQSLKTLGPGGHRVKKRP